MADKIGIGSKVKVQVGKDWHPAKVVALTHEGTVAEVDRLDDATDKTIYARVQHLRLIK